MRSKSRLGRFDRGFRAAASCCKRPSGRISMEKRPVNDDLGRKRECVGDDYYSCEEAIKRLNEYLDHQLTQEERAVVIKHLEICKPCLSRFSFEQTLIISLRTKLSTL